MWWATAGLALLNEGFLRMGLIGVFLVVFGHWVSDFGYYSFISFLTTHKKEYLLKKMKFVKFILAIFLILIAIYFVYKGIFFLG